MADRSAVSNMPPRGLSIEVLAAGLLFSASSLVTGLSAVMLPQDPPSALLLLGWPMLALVGGVLLDRQASVRIGRTYTVLSLAPLFIVGWSFARFDAPLASTDLARGAGELASPLAVGTAIGITWAFRSPHSVPAAVGFCLLAACGSVVVLAAGTGGLDEDLAGAGWALAVVGSVGVWALVARSIQDGDRAARRRMVWLLITMSVGGGVVAGAWTRSGTPGYYATCAVTILGSIAVANLWLRTDFRPLDEHLFDIALVVAVVATAAAAGALVHVGSELANRPSTAATALFTAALAMTMAAPAALWVRRTVLARRYGHGLITPEDVALITADLHAKTEPRDLLDKAARMVAAASGRKQARIVLGEDVPIAPDHWVVHPLVVGGDRVGALLVESTHPDGPEVRQQKVVAQLLPTVALVAHAVALAIEAEHARRDVARERDAERKRVMGDLHDGLGPALSGMSMRVQAALRTTTTPEHARLLRDIADGLATARSDLRRIVTGITPSTLEDGNLEEALSGLIESFQAAGGKPQVSLTVALTDPVNADVQVAVYRSVAEGITNALRHAGATSIAVHVHCNQGRVLVDVVDDGVGGPVVPGVGLSSLAHRAERLGGRMSVFPRDPAGTTLHVDLPALASART